MEYFIYRLLKTPTRKQLDNSDKGKVGKTTDINSRIRNYFYTYYGKTPIKEGEHYEVLGVVTTEDISVANDVEREQQKLYGWIDGQIAKVKEGRHQFSSPLLNSKKWKVIDYNSKEEFIVTNLRQYCLDNGINYTALTATKDVQRLDGTPKRTKEGLYVEEISS